VKEKGESKMGVDLFGNGKNLMLNWFWWGVILNTAEEYGWKAMKTRAPDPSLWSKEITEQSPEPSVPWSGSNYTNDSQSVCEEDEQYSVDSYSSLWTEELPEQSPEPEKPWSGSYCSNDLQEVCEEDAQNIANALHLGIIDLEKGQRDQELIEAFYADKLKNGWSVPPAEEFRQNVIEACEEFIDFCKGPFLIG
jgi:hypothetical protein